MINQEKYNKLYEYIKEEGIQQVILNKIDSPRGILNEYDKKDIIICLYLVAIDNEDLESLMKLNFEISKNKIIEETDIVYNIYIKNLLSVNRLKKIISLNFGTEIHFEITTKLLISLIKNEEIKLIKILFNNILFDNNFVLSLLYYYKYKKSLSNSKLQNFIINEKKKIDLNQLFDYDDYTFLSYSCEKGNEEIIKCLIKQGANIEKRNQLGETPLFNACRSKKVNIVKYLLECGAKINRENILGETPLFIACEIKNEMIAKILIDYGAEINKEDNDGETPLFIACEYGNLNKNLIKMLVEHGALVNKENEYGRTPLFYVIEYGNEDIVKYLVQHGADINKKDDNGNTPIFFAYKNKKDNIIKYLIDQGADKVNNI
ncbi:ankyrin [Piromyces finnis]|uniref:Ankyrin n=1 Tax=Piromyces finnis TaxID=1754191 RepID=A0A1Y1V839_9FUNG|nr:ankyrin [Piromyces finnis]|eukprot:ORX49627.1 ankyrin [Piromyces finnis]